MNEQLQQALAVLIEKSINGIDASVDFMQAEIPEVIEQLLVWYAVKGFIMSLFGLCLVSSVAYFIFRGLTSKKELSDGDSNYFWSWDKGFSWEEPTHKIRESVFIYMMICFFVLIVGMLMLFDFLTPLQIWIAPKVWLIEYASKIAS